MTRAVDVDHAHHGRRGAAGEGPASPTWQLTENSGPEHDLTLDSAASRVFEEYEARKEYGYEKKRGMKQGVS